MMEVISFEAAKAAGMKRYFTGLACRHGHVDERLVSNRGCCTCAEIKQKKSRVENPDHWRFLARKSQEAVRKRNPDRVNATKRRNYVKRAEKARAVERARKRANPALIAATNARRRAALLKAVPSWADHDAIKKIYAESRRLSEETGVKMHVDHIVPLLGDVVCGLHVEYNLRIIPASENLKKNKRFE